MTEFVYNWDGKLREANWDNNSVNLKYDAFGKRIYKESTISGQTTKKKFIVDVVGKLPTILLEIQPGGDGLFGTADDSIGKTYMYANSQIIAQHDGDYTADTYFYLHDRLGSIRQLIDTAGAVIEGVADFHNGLLNFFR